MFVLTGAGQEEADCHWLPREVDEPMVMGEVAGDELRLAEMEGLVGSLLLPNEALLCTPNLRVSHLDGSFQVS